MLLATKILNKFKSPNQQSSFITTRNQNLNTQILKKHKVLHVWRTVSLLPPLILFWYQFTRIWETFGEKAIKHRGEIFVSIFKENKNWQVWDLFILTPFICTLKCNNTSYWYRFQSEFQFKCHWTWIRKRKKSCI